MSLNQWDFVSRLYKEQSLPTVNQLFANVTWPDADEQLASRDPALRKPFEILRKELVQFHLEAERRNVSLEDQTQWNKINSIKRQFYNVYEHAGVLECHRKDMFEANCEAVTEAFEAAKPSPLQRMSPQPN